MEPPQGVRANLTRTYAELPPSFLAAEGQPPPLAQAWRGLVFSCALFHALVQERRKFGPLGWNITYDFSSGDLDCALQTLRMFLMPQPRGGSAEEAAEAHTAGGPGQQAAQPLDIPWPALKYVTGEVRAAAAAPWCTGVKIPVVCVCTVCV